MPPRGVKKGTKRARQYEHIKESQLERGTGEGRAGEIAARTVKQGAGTIRRVPHALPHIDQRHLLRAARRAALRNLEAQGPHA